MLASAPFAFSVFLASGQEEMRSVQSGVFTPEQADRGAEAFEESCRDCHQLDEFSDGAYMEGWSGQTAEALIDQIRSSMPQDNPGSLKRKAYVDIAAFLFRQNGLPSGESEMDATSAEQIRIEGPYRGPSEEDLSER